LYSLSSKIAGKASTVHACVERARSVAVPFNNLNQFCWPQTARFSLFVAMALTIEGEETTEGSAGAQCHYPDVFLMESTHPTQTDRVLERHSACLGVEEKAEYSRV